MKIRHWLAVWVMVGIGSMAWAIPNPHGRVNDFANVLSPDVERQLEADCLNLESQTGVQIALVTVTDFEGMTLEEYAGRLFTQWGVGLKEMDNGLLLLKRVTANPREHGTTRLEVGYGLEGAIPDSVAGRILDESVMPYFFQGDYEAGFVHGLAAIEGRLVSHGVTAEGLRDHAYRSSEPWFITPFVILFLLPFFFIGGRGLGHYLSKRETTVGGKLMSLISLIPVVMFIIVPTMVGIGLLREWLVVDLMALIGFIWAGYKYGPIQSKTGAGRYFSSSSTFMSGRGSGGGGFGGGSSGGGGASR